jgi:3D (Asp-Asp-Asp) domain-containing protein/septal ring factor EnvC (AmiA/AmiB activator)
VHRNRALVGSRLVPANAQTRRRPLLALIAAFAVAVGIALPASGADSPSSLRHRAAALEQQNGAISDRSRDSVLTLYALEARLTRVRAQLASLRSRVAAVERRRFETRRALAVARQLFRASQRNLANRVRAAYEQTDADPLAIVLGAKSIDDALSGLETVNAAAASDRRLVARARRARTAYLRLHRRLTARAAALRRLEAGLTATASSLAAAKAERIAYIQQLAAQRHLNTTQIGSLEAQAQSIDARAQELAVEHAAAPATAASSPVAPPVTTGARTITVLATAYTLSGRTATGAPVGYGVVAVDPNVIPLGTQMTIPGYGEGVAADTGGAIQGAVIDLWFPSPAQAAAWGRRTVTITLH